MALSKFIELFSGRTDAYGSWEGGCVKHAVTQDLYMAHLLGDIGFGTYPVDENNMTRWGCSDIDVPDLDAVRNLQTALSVKQVHTWVERTRRGYHLWLFSTEPVHASVMRRCLLAAHQVCEYPAKEVNPKQEVVTSGYGNYVRLPYFGGWEKMPTERVVLDDDDTPLTLQQFVDMAHAERTAPNWIGEVAERWTPPVPIARPSFSKALPLNSLVYVMSSYSHKIMSEGPLEGSDRSSTLVRLAYRLRSDGLQPAEALTVLIEADKKWGKFYGREDGIHHLESIVMKAYEQ